MLRRMRPVYLLAALVIGLFARAVGAAPETEAEMPSSPGGVIETVFHCDFSEEWNTNFDEWPDRWQRQHGRRYPHYIHARLLPEKGDDTFSPGQALRVNLNGGAFAASSPLIDVEPIFEYAVSGYLKTSGLHHNRAYLSLTFHDDQEKPLATYESKKWHATSGWQEVRIGPIDLGEMKIRHARITLHVEPASDREDLHGTAVFDEIRMSRLPRLLLRLNNPHHLYFDGETVEISCRTSGFSQENLQVRFQLEDIVGEPIAEKVLALHDQKDSTNLTAGPLERIGRASWHLPATEQGYYRLKAIISSPEGEFNRESLNFVILKPQYPPAEGRFGWSLPQGGMDLPDRYLTRVLTQAGINWVKYPLWLDMKRPESEERLNRLALLYERLTTQGIQIVGLLSDPPTPLKEEKYATADKLSAADLFSPNPEIWYASFEPILTRLSSQVRWWQLGADHDSTFTTMPGLELKVEQVKKALDVIGQDVNLAIGWSWLSAFPQSTETSPPWRALMLSTSPTMTHEELTAYLSKEVADDCRRWVLIQPISRRDYSLETRAIDLVRRMVAVQRQGADVAFCPDPFNQETGLLDEKGRPRELFLTWRTCAQLLAGSKFAGSVQFPEGSENLVFLRPKDAVMIVWNERSVEETIYLGEYAEVRDIWGRRLVPERDGDRHVLKVGRYPLFISGAHRAVMQTRLSFQFSQKAIPSVFGRSHSNSYSFTSGFDRSVGGKVELVMPEIWRASPRETTFRLAEGKSFTQPMQITIPFNSTSGRHAIRADIEIEADGIHRFSVHRSIKLGTGNVYIDVKTTVNAQGELEVQQYFVNDDRESINFRCQLFAPERRRQRTQVVGLRAGSDVQVYRLPNAEALFGKTLWLRAEEIDGPRIFNYRFIAKP